MSFYLGGGIPGRAGKAIAGIQYYEILIGFVVAGGFLILTFTPASMWVSVGWFILGVAVIGGIRAEKFLRQFRSKSDTSHWRALEWAGLDRHIAGSRPGLLDRCDITECETMAGAPVALFRHASRKQVSYTGVIEIKGNTIGVVPMPREDSNAGVFASFLSRVASVRGVTRVDLITQVFPSLQQRTAYGPVEEELALIAAHMGSEHRHFMAVTVDPAQAEADLDLRGGGDDTTTALDLIDEVARLASSHSLPASGVVTPAKVGSLLQTFFFPTWYPDVTAEHGWAAIPSFESSDIAVEVGIDPPWLCSVGLIPADGWPASTIEADWLDPLVTGIQEAKIITVIASHMFVKSRVATKHARGQSALALAKVTAASKAGVVSDGEDERLATAAGWALNDLQNNAAGDTPVVRILVYGSNRGELLRARRAVEDKLAARMQVESFDWCDTGHARALAACLPVGMGIRGLR